MCWYLDFFNFIYFIFSSEVDVLSFYFILKILLDIIELLFHFFFQSSSFILMYIFVTFTYGYDSIFQDFSFDLDYDCVYIFLFVSHQIYFGGSNFFSLDYLFIYIDIKVPDKYFFWIHSCVCYVFFLCAPFFVLYDVFYVTQCTVYTQVVCFWFVPLFFIEIFPFFHEFVKIRRLKEMKT